MSTDGHSHIAFLAAPTTGAVAALIGSEDLRAVVRGLLVWAATLAAQWLYAQLRRRFGGKT